jgi:hypothetical protein
MAVDLMHYWPIGVGLCVVMIAQLWHAFGDRVPNGLTLGAIGVAWLLSLSNANLRGTLLIQGDLGASLLAAFLPMLILLPFYGFGLGAGCVKSQMAFGAWVGCGLSLVPALAAAAAATILSVILTYAGCLIAMVRAPRDTENAPYEFPAQLTFVFGNVLGIMIFWLASALW